MTPAKDQLPRSPDGTFGQGAGWTPEQAREAAIKSHAAGVRKSKSAIEENVLDLLAEAGLDASAPTTIRILAEKAVKGSSADLRLFLQQTGQLQNANEKYDGKGPCPTCGQTPGEGLTIAAAQVGSLGHTLEQLETLVAQSEALVAREKALDGEAQ